MVRSGWLMGHRIGLHEIVLYYNESYSPEMLVGQFPTLSLALIHKTIAFYLENRAEVDAYVAAHEAACARLRAAARKAPGLQELRQRLQAMRKAETQ
jgi:uncharacterized protein (DUF433 family)